MPHLSSSLIFRDLSFGLCTMMALKPYRLFFLAVCVSAAVQALQGAPPAAEESPPIPTGFTEPIDLSYPINLHTQNWPGSRTFEFTKKVAAKDPDGGFYASNEFCTAEHAGTHLDAPFHFNETAWKVGQIPLKHLLAPGVLIDASQAAASNRDLSLGEDALVAWEEQHGRVPEGSVVLLRFGWAHKYSDRKDYYGLTTDDRNHTDTTNLSFPGASKELAEALVERKIFGVGLDTPSIDAGKIGVKSPYPAHRVLCGANIYILENVDITTTALPPKGFSLIVMPAKLEEGSGAPVRIVALPGNAVKL